MEEIFYVNGQYVRKSEAKISVKDLVVLRGFGVFDFMVTHGQYPITLTENIKRFRKSANQIELPLLHSDQEIIEIINETLRKNKQLFSASQEFSIRLIYTGGLSKDNVSYSGDNSFICMVEKFSKDCSVCETGVKIITVDYGRLFPQAKTTMYVPAVLTKMRVHEKGAYEGIYLDQNQFVLEGASSSVFAFFNGVLTTPPLDSILAGVTRSVLLKLAERCQIPIEIRAIHIEELLKAEEVFITSAGKRIIPVVRVNDSVVGSGSVGWQVKALLFMLEEVVLSEIAKGRLMEDVLTNDNLLDEYLKYTKSILSKL